MVSRVLLVYLVVELAVVVALVSTIGWGWTLLLLVATFGAGLAVAGVQIGRHFRWLLTGWKDPDRVITDSVLIALGTVLVAVPGLASTVAGLLCLLSPTRAAARPVLTALAFGGLGRRVVVARQPRHRDYIDGEVIDVGDVSSSRDATPPALPARATP